MHKKRYETWIKFTDSVTKNELMSMTEQQIIDAFYKELEFGTAGLRGEMGAGSNRLNIYTVRKASKGVADYLNSAHYSAQKNLCENKSSSFEQSNYKNDNFYSEEKANLSTDSTEKTKKIIAISYDSRNNSEVFAKAAAEVFASEGIEVYITKELMPSPFLSYITRNLGADLGVLITASHNPKQYNGYKVCDGEGCQISEQIAHNITKYIENTDAFNIITQSFDKYLANKNIRYVDSKKEDDYINEIFKTVKGSGEGIKVMYSPLNGTGYKIVPKVLKKLGADVNITSLQDTPDGNFPTCPYPNPEKKEAMELSIEQAEKIKADIVIATDPDADRMGMAIRHNDKYVLLTGNETGVLFAEYILQKNFSCQKNSNTCAQNFVQNHDNNKNTTGNVGQKKPVIVKSIVTTDLVKEIVAEYDGEVIDVLTGFKNIGGEISKLVKEGRKEDFVLGFEESYGYLSGSYARDKDGVLASALAVVMAAELKKKGKTVYDKLSEIYDKYGYYTHKTISFRFAGASGAQKMQHIMSDFRQNGISDLCGFAPKFTDYLADGQKFHANVLQFNADKLKVILRPSGTEPLIKIYLTAAYNSELNKKYIAQMTEFFEEKFAKY